jgi:Chaperone of endosialidase
MVITGGHKPGTSSESEKSKVYGDFTMSHRKQPSKRKLAPALGAAGLSLSLAGGVSAASAAPTADIQTQNTKLSHEITLYEEEISDVSLGTFYVFDKEKVGTSRRGLKLAQGCGGCGCGQRSDIRLKRDIAQVGKLDSGINLYRYRYLWSDTTYVGVMAQEVAEVVPEAVLRGADGYLRVDYARLGLRLQTWDQWAAAH